MSMTKKERAAFDKALADAMRLGALRWTTDVRPDVPVPKGNEMTTGWLPVYSRVDVACSNTVNHAVGRTDKTTTQQPRQLYSTKLLALRALRHEMEHRFAEQLANVDKQIADEDQS
jgi:hypothetical protein